MHGQLVLRLLCIFRVCWYIYIFICVSTLIMCAIITSRTLLPCDLLSTLARLLCVATVSSLPQLRDRDGYWKQRQRRRDDARLTESRNARSEQLLMLPTESLTNREWLPRELLSGSERQRPGWFLDMKYQTCSKSRYNNYGNTLLCWFNSIELLPSLSDYSTSKLSDSLCFTGDQPGRRGVLAGKAKGGHSRSHTWVLSQWEQCT